MYIHTVVTSLKFPNSNPAVCYEPSRQGLKLPLRMTSVAGSRGRREGGVGCCCQSQDHIRVGCGLDKGILSRYTMPFPPSSMKQSPDAEGVVRKRGVVFWRFCDPFELFTK